MEQGWIKLHRKMLDNVFLMHDDNAFIVFTKLLLMVNKRTGQIATGRNALGESMHINPRTLYDVIIRLENQHLINIESNKRYSVLTICNWNKYQSSPTSNPTIAQQQPNNSPTTSQHYNKNKKENKNNINTIVELDKSTRPDVQEIFDLYVKLFNAERTQLSKARRSKIQQRLRDAGRDMLIKAIENTSVSPHHRGDNDRGWKANIDFIIRSYEQVERLSDLNTMGSSSQKIKPNMEELEHLI